MCANCRANVDTIQCSHHRSIESTDIYADHIESNQSTIHATLFTTIIATKQ